MQMSVLSRSLVGCIHAVPMQKTFGATFFISSYTLLYETMLAVTRSPSPCGSLPSEV
jgi:hypothetical protein